MEPSINEADLMKMPKEHARNILRQHIIEASKIKEGLLPRVKEIHAMQDAFTQNYLVEEFEYDHPDFRKACEKLEEAKRILKLVEESK